MPKQRPSQEKKEPSIDLDTLKEGRCLIFNVGEKKGIICKEAGKLVIYEGDAVPDDK